ncbi:MAG: CBS domain-containing protein [Rhodobacteraceae bacterium]|nr:CBS domain-containing protein [Paracoccaceae bacterium]MCB1363004.1 CBS domain-containing protein [Paracoccaceae bacterium]
MLVQQILNSKPIAETLTVTPSATVAQAAALMAQKRIGAVVISADGLTPEGVFSERDIVRELAKIGSGCMDHPVRDYMTREVVTCTRETSARELLEQMTQGRFRHMPVVEDGKMVGLVSIGDVVKAQLTELEMEKGALESMIKGY